MRPIIYWNKMTILKDTVIKVCLGTVICGTDTYTFYKLSQDYTEKEIEDFVWEEALSNAERYGIYLRGDSGEFSEDEDDETEYSDDISGYWEIASEEDYQYDTVDSTTL